MTISSEVMPSEAPINKVDIFVCLPLAPMPPNAEATSSYLTDSLANTSIVVGPWNRSVSGLPKWIQPELKLFTISM